MDRYLWAVIYESLFMSRYLRVLFYESLFTSPYLRVFIHESLFMSRHLPLINLTQIATRKIWKSDLPCLSFFLESAHIILSALFRVSAS